MSTVASTLDKGVLHNPNLVATGAQVASKVVAGLTGVQIMHQKE